MKTLFALALTLVMTSFLTDGQVVKDPFQDFLARMSRKPDDKVFEMTAAVNRNGGSEIFLTYSHSVNGKAGNIWTVYAPISGGYQRLDTPVIFRISHLFIGDAHELGGLGLITYAPGGGGSGSLTGYVFQGTDVQEIDLPDVELTGKDKAVFEKYFSGSHHPAIKITPSSQLPPQ
jgi:hypothetical protein